MQRQLDVNGTAATTVTTYAVLESVLRSLEIASATACVTRRPTRSVVFGRSESGAWFEAVFAADDRRVLDAQFAVELDIAKLSRACAALPCGAPVDVRVEDWSPPRMLRLMANQPSQQCGLSLRGEARRLVQVESSCIFLNGVTLQPSDVTAALEALLAVCGSELRGHATVESSHGIANLAVEGPEASWQMTRRAFGDDAAATLLPSGDLWALLATAHASSRCVRLLWDADFGFVGLTWFPGGSLLLRWQ